MKFVDDPRRSELEAMDEIMTIWADYWRDRHHRGVSSTWIAMQAVRNWSQRVEKIREGLVLGQPIRITRTDTVIIAEKVRKLIHDDALWSGHRRERDVLVTYYLKVHPSWPIGRIAKNLDCKPWDVESTVRNALCYFSLIWNKGIP